MHRNAVLLFVILIACIVAAKERQVRVIDCVERDGRHWKALVQFPVVQSSVVQMDGAYYHNSMTTEQTHYYHTYIKTKSCPKGEIRIINSPLTDAHLPTWPVVP